MIISPIKLNFYAYFTELFLDILKSLPDKETRLFSGCFLLLSSSNYYVSKYSNIFKGVLRLGELAVRLLLNDAFLSGLETITNQSKGRHFHLFSTYTSTKPKKIFITFGKMHKLWFDHQCLFKERHSLLFRCSCYHLK